MSKKDIKIVCQNCECILAFRNSYDKTFYFEESKEVDVLYQESSNETIITLQCPECECILQIKE